MPRKEGQGWNPHLPDPVGATPGMPLEPGYIPADSYCDQLLSDLRTYVTHYGSVADKLGLSKTDSFQNARQANAVLEYLYTRPLFHEKVWYDSAKNAAALDIVDAAKGRALQLHQSQNALDAVWSDSVHNLDLAEMRRTLFEEYVWLYDDSQKAKSMEDQLSVHLRSAQEILDKAKSVVNAYTRATEVLGVERADTTEGLRSIAALLKQVSEVPHLETPWFDVRKNEAARPLLNDAYAHYRCSLPRC